MGNYMTLGRSFEPEPVTPGTGTMLSPNALVEWNGSWSAGIRIVLVRSPAFLDPAVVPDRWFQLPCCPEFAYPLAEAFLRLRHETNTG